LGPIMPDNYDPFAGLRAAEDAAPFVVPLELSAGCGWRQRQLALLNALVRSCSTGDEQRVALADCPIWYSLHQIRELQFCIPDFFIVFGTIPKPNLRRWMVWDEAGKYPDVIIELLSPTTAVEDRTVKKQVYERTFKTDDYFLYDPETRQLEGWRLVHGRHQRIEPDGRGWLWSEQLKLWLGTWEGPYQNRPDVWLRFYDAEGQVVPLFAEAEKQRAEQAEAELVKLRAMLAAKQATGDGPA
jgi:hypothetical protein